MPAGAGGAGGTVADLAAALEQVGDALVPGPVLPTLLAGLILARLTGRPAAQELLPALAEGKEPVAVGFTSASLAGAWLPGGGLRVTGEVSAVLGAGSTARLLLGADTGRGEAWFLLGAGQPGVTVTARAPLDFSRPLASVRLTGLVIGPDQVLPGLSTAGVRDLAATLCAAEAAGGGGLVRAHGRRVRRGSGTSSAGRSGRSRRSSTCAPRCCAAPSAPPRWPGTPRGRPTRRPASSAAGRRGRRGARLDAAVDNAKDCIQVLGGIGFTWEHDAHLYLRRALALRQLLGGSARLAGRGRGWPAWPASRRELPRREVDAGRAATTPAGRRSAPGRDAAIAALPPDRQRAALADAGYLAPHWPRALRPGAPSAAQQLVIDEELSRGRGGPARPGHRRLGRCRPSSSTARDAQRERFVGPTLRGEITWCQLFSEPGAGSDLASLRTRAERVDGGWRLTGQKVWTSLAREADWAICLARTDPDAPKHAGITLLPGRHAQRRASTSARCARSPVRRCSTRSSSTTCSCPTTAWSGELGDGWRVARTTLATERVAMGAGSALGEAVEGLLARSARGAARPPIPVAAEQSGALVADGHGRVAAGPAPTLAQLRGGRGRGPSRPCASWLGVAAPAGGRRGRADAVRRRTARAEPTARRPTAADEFLLTRCLSIAGGTTQILLSLVAERVLGLPREEAR